LTPQAQKELAENVLTLAQQSLNPLYNAWQCVTRNTPNRDS